MHALSLRMLHCGRYPRRAALRALANPGTLRAQRVAPDLDVIFQKALFLMGSIRTLCV